MLDYMIYIGRFQPAHLGHIATMRTALDKAKRLIVVIGSHNEPRTIKNPFFSFEREEMIRLALTEEENSRVDFVYAENRLYSNTFWAQNVEKLVNGVIESHGLVNPTIGIIGNGKGDRETSEYVNYFKQWKRIPMDCVTLSGMVLHATKIRELMYTDYAPLIKDALPHEAYVYVMDFMNNEEFNVLRNEYQFHVNEEKKYENVPYNSYTRYTADAVVIQSGHILLVRRKSSPGLGLWALPGGHVEQKETAFDAAIRELFEETNIKLQREVLERCMFQEKLFDHPERSMVGRISKKVVRTTTVAYGFKLDDNRDLPKVRGNDEACEVSEARWFSFAEVESMRDRLFEDHADIINFFLSRVPE